MTGGYSSCNDANPPPHKVINIMFKEIPQISNEDNVKKISEKNDIMTRNYCLEDNTRQAEPEPDKWTFKEVEEIEKKKFQRHVGGEIDCQREGDQ